MIEEKDVVLEGKADEKTPPFVKNGKMRVREIRDTGCSYTTTFSIRFHYVFWKGKVYTCPVVGHVSKGYMPNRLYYQGVPSSGVVITMMFSGTGNTKFRQVNPESLIEKIERDGILPFTHIEGNHSLAEIKTIISAVHEYENTIKDDAIDILKILPSRGTFRPKSAIECVADISYLCNSYSANIEYGMPWNYYKIRTGVVYPPVVQRALRISGHLSYDKLYSIRGRELNRTVMVDCLNIAHHRVIFCGLVQVKYYRAWKHNENTFVDAIIYCIEPTQVIIIDKKDDDKISKTIISGMCRITHIPEVKD